MLSAEILEQTYSLFDWFKKTFWTLKLYIVVPPRSQLFLHITICSYCNQRNDFFVSTLFSCKFSHLVDNLHHLEIEHTATFKMS